MTELIRKIAFLVDKKELDFLNEACLYGANADKNLEKAVKEGGNVFTKDVRRKICLPSSKSLFNFAKVIIKTFGFYFDHCFGYYDNFQRYHDSKKAYELFVDIGEETSSPTIKGVKKTQIRQVFQNPGDKMLFLFDYGDGWRFGIELIDVKYIDKWNLDPVVLKSIGGAPGNVL